MRPLLFATLGSALTYFLSAALLGLASVFSSGPHWQPPEFFNWLPLAFAAAVFALIYWQYLKKQN